MYTFHRIWQHNSNIKCQFPDCQNHAIWLEKMPLFDILLCEQHMAQQKAIHINNNLPYDEAPDLLMYVETPENQPTESSE